MQIYMRVCPICAKENIRKETHSKIYVPGWINWFLEEQYADTTCEKHPDQRLIKMAMTCEEFQILYYISNEPSFMQAMNDLKEKDIIEYQLKLSQFRNQVQQQKNDQVQSDTTPRCPHCKSTNIKPISALNRGASIAMWGIFSKKINKSFECLNCKYTW